jgi:hypothetical protein
MAIGIGIAAGVIGNIASKIAKPVMESVVDKVGDAVSSNLENLIGGLLDGPGFNLAKGGKIHGLSGLNPSFILANIDPIGIGGFLAGNIKDSIKGSGKRVMPDRQRPSKGSGPYTNSVSNKLDEILSSNASVEEKIVLLAAVMADKLDQEAEKMMGKWSEELKRVGAQGDHKNKQATKGSDEGQQLEMLRMRLQQITQKKNQLISTASNVLKASHSTKTAVISNLRL